ncbi:hypothetical protein PoB_004645500 [Plakobranchus ocellatus]|uniref:Uncharacterized protein n=1 Tax=Plakobranchus ocellatus TaxID=259542 RepID=A0AAV4BLM2_9GAST|nr:hypothetical protein PoB_004645500 [Plakobranchus ocellatus]
MDLLKLFDTSISAHFPSDKDFITDKFSFQDIKDMSCSLETFILRAWLSKVFSLLIIILEFGFLCISSPQQGDLRLSGLPSGQSAGGGARTRDRGIRADIRADSLATVSLYWRVM